MRALSIKPDFAEAYNNMAIVLTSQGNVEEAIEALNTALFLKPEYAEAYTVWEMHCSSVQSRKQSSLQILSLSSLILVNKTGIALTHFYKGKQDLTKTIVSLLDREGTLDRVILPSQ